MVLEGRLLMFFGGIRGSLCHSGKAEKSFLLKCECIFRTNFCVWVNLKRDKVRIIINKLLSFISLDTYEVSFEEKLNRVFSGTAVFP